MTGLPEDDGHFLLADARTVGTDLMRDTLDDLSKVVRRQAMAVVHGEAGLGKTFAVLASLRDPDVVPEGTSVCWVQFRANPSTRDIRVALFEGLGITRTFPRKPAEAEAIIKKRLSDQPWVVVCDEAQQLSSDCFELWRHLWDTKSTRVAIIFVGGNGCQRVILSEKMMSSRILTWRRFTPMSRREVLQNIPAFHPVWDDADLAVIADIDARAAHGNFRHWAKITVHVLDAMEMSGAPKVTMDLVEHALTKMPDDDWDD